MAPINQPAAPSRPGGHADAPLALVNGRPITLDDISASLLEAAGGEILEETVLDLALDAEARRRGITISADDLAHERALFLESLADTGVSRDPAHAEDLLLQVRRARGLGPERFDHLLRRSALLRAMVRDDVVITDEMISLAHKIAHGERRRARLITTTTLAQAQKVVDALAAGADFSEVAARFSTDASALRGGLVEPISPADPSYPDALRRTLARLSPGQTSGPIALDAGFAIVRLQAVIPPDDVSLDATRQTLARRLRLQEERRRMTDLANRLRGRSDVTILDPRLRFSASSR